MSDVPRAPEGAFASFEAWIIQRLLAETTRPTLRISRFLAMYFPHAAVRRKFWRATCVEIGEGSFLNPNCVVADDYMNGRVLLRVGKNCSIAPGVVFAPISNHNNSVELRSTGILDSMETDAPIIIEDDVWIGANCTVAGGVTIGRCSVIGANSFVNVDVPPYSLAAGTPARVRRSLLP